MNFEKIIKNFVEYFNCFKKSEKDKKKMEKTIRKEIKEEDILKDCTLKNTKKFNYANINCLCKVLKVYDGDTITVAIYYEKKIHQVSCRLMGIDCAEKNPKNKKLDGSIDIEENKREKAFALLTTNYLSNLILEKICYLKFESKQNDKYKRSLIYISENKKSTSINNKMIIDGYAYKYMGKKKKKFSEWKPKPKLDEIMKKDDDWETLTYDNN